MSQLKAKLVVSTQTSQEDILQVNQWSSEMLIRGLYNIFLYVKMTPWDKSQRFIWSKIPLSETSVHY